MHRENSPYVDPPRAEGVIQGQEIRIRLHLEALDEALHHFLVHSGSSFLRDRGIKKQLHPGAIRRAPRSALQRGRDELYSAATLVGTSLAERPMRVATPIP